MSRFALHLRLEQTMNPDNHGRSRILFEMKQFAFAFALVCMLPTVLIAKPRIALISLQGEESVSASQLDYLGAAFRLALIRSGISDTVLAQKSEAALSQNPEQKGFLDSELASRIGKSAGADHLLAGYVFQENEKQRIMILLYRVETGEVLSKEEILLSDPLTQREMESKFGEAVGRLGIALGVPATQKQSLSNPAKDRAFRMGLIYPGLGHLSAGKYFTGSLYFGLFSASLYNVLYLTPTGNQRERHRIFKDARMYGLAALSLPTPASRTALFESGFAGYFMAQEIRDRRHDAPVRAAEKTIASAFLLAAAYGLTLADLAFVQLEFKTLPGPRIPSYGITFTYRF
ncbi:MAG: hypothetical protein JNM27_03090 [Leptospirales bacterium]|nr:hypothetical protein [Leptospirales bacterium]